VTQEREEFSVTDEHEADSELDAEETEVAEIRAEIEETRIEMGGTLNELGERLDPGHLMDQAKENVREATIGRVEETAKGMSDMVMETIKRNPVPAALAGAGLALLWTNRSSGNGNRHQADSRYAGGSGTTAMYGRQAYGDMEQGLGSKAASVATDIRDNVAGAAGQVSETIGEVGQTVGQGAQEVGWRFERFMESSPLAMGAIAIGAGAVVGAVIPETPKERELLGEASRAVGETVRDTVSQATDEAEATLERAQQPSA
jgi:ElaB/YqjD/DUF883 family membrane-anchored ribosome-binding protein